MLRLRGTTALLAALLAAAAPHADGQCVVTETRQLLPPAGAAVNQFGESVSAANGWLVVSASTGVQPGRTYVYRDNGGTWDLDQILPVGTGASTVEGVATDGTTIVVGNGSLRTASVFVYDGDNWVLQQTLVPSPATDPSDGYGRTVDVKDDVILVGAPRSNLPCWPGGEDFDCGLVHVYRRVGGVFIEETVLQGPKWDSAYFGDAVSVDGDAIAVGARSPCLFLCGPGSVWIFRDQGGNWVQQQILNADDGANADNFGFSVALEGSRLLAGAIHNHSGAPAIPGDAHVFDESGGAWTESDVLQAAGPAINDWSGFAVELDGEVAVMGAPNGTLGPAVGGTARVLRHTGAGWVGMTSLVATDDASGNGFGRGVAVDGTNVFVGAPGNDAAGNNVGAVYVYELAFLVLNVDPLQPGSGASITATTCGGLPGAASLLAMVSPIPLQLVLLPFDASGQAQVTLGPIPPGFAGLSFTLQSVGVLAPGAVGASNPATITLGP